MSLTKADLTQLDKLFDHKLKSFATKDDLKSFATKDDLKKIDQKLAQFATKDDLKKIALTLTKFATKDDLHQISKSITVQIATKLDLKNLKSELTSQFSHLTTKEEFFMAMDKWMKASSTADIERPLHRREHEKIRKFLEFATP